MNDLQKLKAYLRENPPADDANPSDLEPLIAHLRQNGMGRQVDSWIGQGPNEEVDPEELERALTTPANGQPVALGGGILGSILGGLLNGGMGGRAAPAPAPRSGGGLGGAMGGLGGGILGGLLAQALPYIINAMTPRGRVDDRDAPSGGLGSIIESITKGGGAGRVAPRDDGRLPDTGNSGDLSGMLGRGLGERR